MRLSTISRWFLLIALNKLRSQIKSITSQTKLHVYCKHDFGSYTRGSFVCIFNPFQENVSFLYPLKMSQNQRFSDVFRWYRKGTLASNGLNDLDNISILLDKDNDSEEEITHQFNKVVLLSILKKTATNQTLKYTQKMHRNTGQLQRTSGMFSGIATVWFGLKAQFSLLIKS